MPRFFSLMIHRILLPLLVLASASHAGNWPEWRGPSAQGHATASGLPETWSETSNVAWKTELPGRGHSTPVMWGDQIWLTTALEKAATPEEAKRRLESNTGDQPLTVLGSVSLHALCVDRTSGKVLHDIELLNVKEPQWAHQLNSYASPSPVLAEGRLYAHFGSFGTVALDTKTLKVLWKNEELLSQTNPGNSSIKISLEKQRGFLMNGEEIVMDYPICSGIPSRPTPVGTFYILEKTVDKKSNKYGRIYDAAGDVVNSDADSTIDAIPNWNAENVQFFPSSVGNTSALGDPSFIGGSSGITYSVFASSHRS